MLMLINFSLPVVLTILLDLNTSNVNVNLKAAAEKITEIYDLNTSNVNVNRHSKANLPKCDFI